MSNSLEPDQDRHCVGPYLVPKCLERLSADDKSGRQQGKSTEGDNYPRSWNNLRTIEVSPDKKTVYKQ